MSVQQQLTSAVCSTHTFLLKDYKLHLKQSLSPLPALKMGQQCGCRFFGQHFGWCVLERYYLGAEDPQLAAAVCVDELEKKKKKQTPPFFQQARSEETCLRPSCTMARCSAVRFHKSSPCLRPDMSIPPLSLRYIGVFISAPLPSYSPSA